MSAKKIGVLGFLAATGMFTAGTATAEGLYFSGQIGSTTLGHTIERNTGGTVLPVPDTSGVSLAETTDISAGVGVGYQRNFSNDQFYWGAEAFYNFEDASQRNINGVLVTDIDLNSTYGARVIGGVNVTPDFSVYAHAGITQVDFDVRNSYTFAPPVRTGSFDETGFSFGFGANYKISDKTTVFADYTKITDVNFGGLPEVAGGTGRVNPNSLEFDKISLGVKVSF